MSVQVKLKSMATATETLTDASLASNGNSVVHDWLDTSETLNASSTPPVSKVSSGTLAMSSGAATLTSRHLLARTVPQSISPD